MDRWRGKIAVVTGAASGIGKAITCALLRNGVNVVGIDMRADRLSKMSEEVKEVKEEYGGTEFFPIVCDVSQEDELETAFDSIEESFGGLDIMVNNAGVTDYTRVIESDRKAFQRLLNIDVLAVAVGIGRAVRSMRARNVEGHVFNVNSVLGHRIPDLPLSDRDGCNGWNLYPSCKHGTVALTGTVRRELNAVKARIRITSISPGLVKTEIVKHCEALKDLFDKVPALEPEDIADAVIYALGTRPEVQVSELIIEHRGMPSSTGE